MHCYLEAAQTNSVVVEIPKPFLVEEQVRDKLVKIDKTPTNLAGNVVGSAFFAVFSQKNCWIAIFMEDCRIIIRRITEIKLTRSQFVSSMFPFMFPAKLHGHCEIISNYILPRGEFFYCVTTSGKHETWAKPNPSHLPSGRPQTQGVCNHN